MHLNCHTLQSTQKPQYYHAHNRHQHAPEASTQNQLHQHATPHKTPKPHYTPESNQKRSLTDPPPIQHKRTHASRPCRIHAPCPRNHNQPVVSTQRSICRKLQPAKPRTPDTQTPQSHPKSAHKYATAHMRKSESQKSINRNHNIITLPISINVLLKPLSKTNRTRIHQFNTNPPKRPAPPDPCTMPPETTTQPMQDIQRTVCQSSRTKITRKYVTSHKEHTTAQPLKHPEVTVKPSTYKTNTSNETQTSKPLRPPSNKNISSYANLDSTIPHQPNTHSNPSMPIKSHLQEAQSQQNPQRPRPNEATPYVTQPFIKPICRTSHPTINVKPKINPIRGSITNTGPHTSTNFHQSIIQKPESQAGYEATHPPPSKHLTLHNSQFSKTHDTMPKPQRSDSPSAMNNSKTLNSIPKNPAKDSKSQIRRKRSQFSKIHQKPSNNLAIGSKLQDPKTQQTIYQCPTNSLQKSSNTTENLNYTNHQEFKPALQSHYVTQKHISSQTPAKVTQVPTHKQVHPDSHIQCKPTKSLKPQKPESNAQMAKLKNPQTGSFTKITKHYYKLSNLYNITRNKNTYIIINTISQLTRIPKPPTKINLQYHTRYLSLTPSTYQQYQMHPYADTKIEISHPHHGNNAIISTINNKICPKQQSTSSKPTQHSIHLLHKSPKQLQILAKLPP
eukprot:gene3166-2148_t